MITHAPPTSNLRREPQRILLMLLLPIGDTLFTTPAIHALRKRYPQAHIAALVYPTNLGILRSNPDINEFLLWPTREAWPGITGVLRLFWKLRRSRFQLAVEFCSYIWWLTRLSGIPQRTEMHLPRFWWVLPWAGRDWRKRHAVEHYADVVRRLDIPVEDMSLHIHWNSEEAARAQSWFDKYNVGPQEMLIGLHLGGEGLWGRKRWGVEGFAQIVDRLHEELGARVIVMGGKDDGYLAADLASRTKAPIINAVGQTSLGETASMAARCSIFIGNDSSPIHIATAAGTRVVGIYGPTDPRSYRPWLPGGKEGEDYVIVRSSLPCAGKFTLVGGITIVGWIRAMRCPALSVITPEQLLNAVRQLLKADRGVSSQKGKL